MHKQGANIPKLLRTSRLEHFRLEESEDYVPLNYVYQLFNAIHHQEGIEDFIEAFAEIIQLVSLSRWDEMIAVSPDVLTALQNAKKYDRVVLTHEHAGFDMGKNKKSCGDLIVWVNFITDK